MTNTLLTEQKTAIGLKKFGDTDFYLQCNDKAQRYEILDTTYDAFNCVISYPYKYGIDIVQDLFNSWYAGYEYGMVEGESSGRSGLQREIKKLLGM